MTPFKKKSSAKAGLLPGTAVYVGENPPVATQVSVHIYDAKSYKKLKTFQPELVRQALANKQHVWIDVYGLANTEQITRLCAEFAIHPLIIEDILNTRQRSKLDDLEDCLFIIFKMLDTPTHNLTYNIEQFSMVLKENLLLSFRESNRCDFTPLEKRLKAKEPIIREQSSEYLGYMIMDCIIDNYFNFVEECEQILEKMENLLIKNPAAINLTNLYTMKRRTMTLRKVIAPLNDIVHILVIEQKHLLDVKYILYYRDLFDHTARLLESIDLQRETINGILEMYLSTLNTRMNETMKILTVFASLFIPLTFIAGIYGMNFVYMPELKWRYSYPAILFIMLILAMLMFYYFKRKRLL
ncbi:MULTISPECIES: magnesium/cobalt transporter CorA [Legionella]|uniref:Magnesium transport protein CorA n=1 Tax=Legionella maceachernii TaxID=466 RepID=A0A0W0W1Z3_9GAMM|nr:magnesium/cobalt transporter CorA [Legionella maceachernii]KTD26259.1 cobalt/magnesium uptake transporter [Legionella maceachernii]SKA09832.1 magnesium transporter [Legionella maceachernii]SUO99458.1 Magnesium transport protein CorA [Legionella maceachernii]